MTKDNIRWACIQPLTGGMYIGAEEAIGHPAEFILSYKGLNDVKIDESTGKAITSGNEYNLTTYLKKHNKMPAYYVFEHSMFDNIDLNKVKTNIEDEDATFNNIDLVVAVPVCSGLSQATIAGSDTKNERNCNMEFIANYVLNIIHPKVYIFENAPGLVSEKGREVREYLENIAKCNGYSISYVKTDTKYHHNCQKRPRTFIVFQLKTSNYNNYVISTSDIRFERFEEKASDYLNKIPANATQQVPFDMSELNRLLVKWCNEHSGSEWREKIGKVPMHYITKNNLYNEFIDFVNNNCNDNKEHDKIVKWIRHVEDKVSKGLNYYSNAIWYYEDQTPSIQFKTIQSLLHHKEDRLLTVREALWLMGMPMDFELQGDKEIDGPKIGQNVPVKTAKYIVDEAIRWLVNWDDVQNERKHGKDGILFDNTKKKIEYEF